MGEEGQVEAAEVIQERALRQTSSVKGQTLNTSSFAGHTVFAAATPALL